MNTLLDGKVAVVTGAGRGVGRAHALHLAALGARVIVNDLGVARDGAGRTDGPADDVCQEIRHAGGQCEPNYGDVADEAGSAALIDQAIESFGGLDILVCNAGIIRERPIHEMSTADWDLIQSVNLRGHFLPCRDASRYWRDRSASTGGSVDASVILTSSRAGLAGSAGYLGYATSKAAIATMAVVIARDLEQFGVRANAICPRARTRMTVSNPGYSRPTPGSDFDLTAPENNSPMVGYLASHLSRGVTGQVFVTGADGVEWIQGWVRAGTVAKTGAPFTPEEIHAGASALFGDSETRPTAGMGSVYRDDART
ncbi:SDR family NAD(P)-dependent oxidoreductase [Rhodococcus sp. NPDC127528]|uniref:SDR family NAD(P)-dependent oxidoreductase n=1 Tax=unclassified Rhodococcus (in: high G+C Gram-positive bacteria) TaxID=192944 RepID=UPI0036327EBC